MAKQKGGLGRGLSSLLGSEAGGVLPQEKASPVERIVADAEKERRESDASKSDAPASKSAKQDKQKSKTAVNQPDKVETSSLATQDEIYTNKEDDVTIKGFVERPVDIRESRQTVGRQGETPKRHPSQSPVMREKQPDKGLTEADEVPISQVQPNPYQPRTNFKKEEIEELAESIKKNGLLQPILVRKAGNGYQIIAGERRWQACRLLGMERIPVRVREVDDEETIILALVENIQRSDLNPIEEAYGYRRMMERGKMTQSQVAQAVSKGRSTVANALRLLDLPEEAQQLLFEERITAGHARAILSIPTKEGRDKLTEKLVSETLSVRETESIARLYSRDKSSMPAPVKQTPKAYKMVARSLRESLQTDVRVKTVKGKNKIEIEFKDEADLERLFKLITGE